MRPILFTLTIAALIFFGGEAAAIDYTTSLGKYPNTETCTDETLTIDFPTEVTISKTYLFVATCDTPTDFNQGDFVSAWIQDSEGSPIYNISQYEVISDMGVVWISPLADNKGQAWEHVTIDPAIFDCNSTGIDYNIHINWDGNTAAKIFSVYCPTILLEYYREEMPYWEQLKVEVSVTDQRGYAMRGIACRATVLDITTDQNFHTIKQQTEEQVTDGMGRARFTFSSGFLNDLLQGFEYTTVISCLGADANFGFEVVETEGTYFRNPLYFFIVFLSDNIVPIIFAFIVAGLCVGALYLLLSR